MDAMAERLAMLEWAKEERRSPCESRIWSADDVLAFARREVSLVADKIEEVLNKSGSVEALRDLRALAAELRG